MTATLSAPGASSTVSEVPQGFRPGASSGWPCWVFTTGPVSIHSYLNYGICSSIKSHWQEPVTQNDVTLLYTFWNIRYIRCSMLQSLKCSAWTMYNKDSSCNAFSLLQLTLFTMFMLRIYVGSCHLGYPSIPLPGGATADRWEQHNRKLFRGWKLWLFSQLKGQFSLKYFVGGEMQKNTFQ